MFVGGGTGEVSPPPPAGGDVDGPIITNVRSKVLSKKQGTFEITWTTNEPGTSGVLFIDPLQLFESDNYVTDHRMVFQAPRRSTLTYFVESYDAAGNPSNAYGPYVHQN